MDADEDARTICPVCCSGTGGRAVMEQRYSDYGSEREIWEECKACSGKGRNKPMVYTRGDLLLMLFVAALIVGMGFAVMRDVWIAPDK